MKRIELFKLMSLMSFDEFLNQIDGVDEFYVVVCKEGLSCGDLGTAENLVDYIKTLSEKGYRMWIRPLTDESIYDPLHLLSEVCFSKRAMIWVNSNMVKVVS